MSTRLRKESRIIDKWRERLAGRQEEKSDVATYRQCAARRCKHSISPLCHGGEGAGEVMGDRRLL